VALYAAPVEMEGVWEQIAWSTEAGGVDLGAARRYALNNLYQTEAEPRVMLAAPAKLTSVNLVTADRRDFCGTAEFVSRAGTLHGFVGFFSAALSRSTTLTNGPPKRTSSWAHTFLPLEQPLPIAKGQRIEIRVETAANGSVWRWRTAIDGETIFDQSTMWGFPLDLAARERRHQ
jgi:PRMT5 oligomerisation domain